MYYKAMNYFGERRNLDQYLVFKFHLVLRFQVQFKKAFLLKSHARAQDEFLTWSFYMEDGFCMCISRCSKWVPDSQLETED